MKKVLYLHSYSPYHPAEAAGELLKKWLAADGRFELVMTSDLDALARLPGSDYAVVVVFTTLLYKDLTPERERGLLGFIWQGGGFVGIHSASDSFRDSQAYLEMLGGEFQEHNWWESFPVSIVDRSHYITTRLPDYTIGDEMYHLQKYDPGKVTLLAQAPWRGGQTPMVYTKEYGRGRATYLANGHDLRAWNHPTFQKLLIRAIAWGAGASKPERKIHCGILGYGPTCNMGRCHSGWINAVEGLETVAICDASPARLEVARQEVPGLRGYFTKLDDMLAMDELDMVTVIVPHSLHKPMAMRCLEAGKHVIVEKPFALNVAETNSMIALAREKGLMLSVFQNRRWDDEFVTIKDILARGLIGDVFHIEAFCGSYAHPGYSWRSDKAVSGGVLYDWGAHFADWILNLVPARVTQVMGDLQKRVWMSVNAEDHGQVFIRFENGVTADLMISNIAASARPTWRILGTQGSLEGDWGKELAMVSYVSGVRQESRMPFMKLGYPWGEYYRNIADHLLFGEELLVKPEQSRRVIAIFEAAERSAQTGASVPVAEGCE
jgi:scyllo-inositol 2-dehydrogenase (NADP+)